MKCAIVGATGYVGTRLIDELLEHGFEVKAMVRDPDKLRDHPSRDAIDAVAIDLMHPESTAEQLADCDAAYYLVHSMDPDGNFESRDAALATSFAHAATLAELDHIVYLGGLGPDTGNESPHLRSRHDVGRLLAAGKAKVTELRAAVILGSGSASFEMVRHLVETLPVMITPKWVKNRVQPVAIRDVLTGLVRALGTGEPHGAPWQRPDEKHHVVHVGGPDIMNYGELMKTYGRVAELPRRIFVPVPFLTPRLSSLWVGFVTPLPVGLARPLVRSLEHDVVVEKEGGAELIGRPALSAEEAIRLALERVKNLEVPSRWSGASIPKPPAAHPHPSDPAWAGGKLLQDERSVITGVSPASIWKVIEGIGGSRGWLVATPLWEIRGLLDQLVGGIGLRRGRRHPDELRVGDALDFWRVDSIEDQKLLRLRAEMLLPGDAWLEFSIEPENDDSTARTVVRQRAMFHPHGLFGRVYWWFLYPVHVVLFPRMLKEIIAQARLLDIASGETAA